jgi:LPXTG-motif cell wall-anchored protein
VSNGGSHTATSAHWDNLGSYDPNDPNRQPIVVTVKGIAEGAGTFVNTVDVHATLGECNGGGLLEGAALVADFLGRANITGDGAVVGGAQVLGHGETSAPTASVLAERVLPTTGGTNRLFTGLGIAALLMAAGVYLFNKKATSSTS